LIDAGEAVGMLASQGSVFVPHAFLDIRSASLTLQQLRHMPVLVNHPRR
jgi:hypothetical protein